MTLDEVIEDMERACALREVTLAKVRGMSAYRGPLCSAVPSVLKDVRWWVARLKELK